MESSAYLAMAAVEEEHWWFAGRRLVLAAIIDRLKLKQDAAILELGSGTGGNYSLLSRFGHVTAIEMNEAARDIFRARHPDADIREGVLPNDLPLDGEIYDLICLFDVLEHIEDDTGTLERVCAHLAPRGALVITVPAFEALFGPHDLELHHKRRYEYAGLKQKLEAAGFKIETLSFMNAALLPVAWVMRWLDKKLRRTSASGTSSPPAPVNALLTTIFGAEGKILPHMALPFGLSLLAVARAGD